MSDRYETAGEAINELENELKKTAVISDQFRSFLMMMARSIAIAAKRDGKAELLAEQLRDRKSS